MELITRSIRYVLLFCLLLTSCGPTGTATPSTTLVPSETQEQIEQPGQTSTPATLPGDAPTWTPTSVPLSTSGGAAAGQSDGSGDLPAHR